MPCGYSDMMWISIGSCLYLFVWLLKGQYRIGGVMVNMLPSGVVDCGFEPRLGQTKAYKIGICCLSAKHAALRSKNKDWLAQNQNNVSWVEWHFYRVLFFQWASTIKIELIVFVKNKVDFIIISLKINLFSPWYSWKIAELNNSCSFSPEGAGICRGLPEEWLCWCWIFNLPEVKTCVVIYQIYFSC